MISSPPPEPSLPSAAAPPEAHRLAVLRDYELLDTSAERPFDQLVELAAQAFAAPMAAISLVDSDRQWLKAQYGLGQLATSRDISFCAHTIEQSGPLIVPDATKDARFATSPLVTGDPQIRFYVGLPIITATGHALGAFCVMDRRPREVSQAQLSILRSLTAVAMELIEQRRLIRRQRRAEIERIRIRSERDQLVNRAAANEARFRAILDALPVAAYTCDGDGLITYFNERAVTAWGRAPKLHDRANRYTGFLDPCDVDDQPVPPERTWMARAIHERQPQLNREVVRQLPDGGRRHFLANASPLFDHAGDLIGAIAVLIDITEAKKVELALRTAEARLETAARAGHVGVGEWDLATNRLHWSHVHAELWDKIPDAFQGTIDEFLARVHPDDRDRLWAVVNRSIADKTDVEHEYRLVRADGGIRWIHSRATTVRDDAGRPRRMVGIVADITETKTAQLKLDQLLHESEASRAALAASEQRYRELFDKHPHPLWVYDVATLAFIAVNAAAIAQYGYSREEFLAMTLKDIRPAEEVPALLAKLNCAAIERGQQRSTDAKHRRKDGSVFNVTISSHGVELNGRPARLVLAIDVTETLALQEQFLRAQRMENLGLLAAGIAHDLNNILTPMMMIAPLLGRRLTSESDLRLLLTVEQSVRRGAGLVKQITAFAKGAGNELAPVQVKHLARDVASIIRETFPRSIRFVADIASDLPVARANPTQVHQVMLNLCVNARDALPDGGELRLTVAARDLDEAAARRMADGRTGRFVLIEVADTGTGIPPEVLERMWEPFFTTKPEGKGTGLGLTTVRGIVARHEGLIEVDTMVGRGTTFRVYLPVDAGAAEATAGSRPSLETHVGAGECILFVDDEPEIRIFAHAALTQHGYRALIAHDAAHALELFKAHQQDIRLVITDHHMPGLKGDELIAALRTLRPRLPVLICSGSFGREWPGLAKEEMLLKPFEPAALLAAIRSLLR